MSEKIDNLLDLIEEKTSPVSIFLYGSRARSDYEKESDYEIGILYRREKKWERERLLSLCRFNKVNLYPFVYEDFICYRADTPFPKAVYFRELVKTGKTLRGGKVLESLKLPEIKVTDLLETVNFQLGYALAGILSSRERSGRIEGITFTKSVLFGARLLVILKLKQFPLTYEEIVDRFVRLPVEKKFIDLVRTALKVRKGLPLKESFLFDNLTFQNQLVRFHIYSVFQKEGNIVLLPGKKL